MEFNQFVIIATDNGHKDMVAYLIGIGLDANQQDSNGSTALVCASQKGHTEIVLFLLQLQNLEIFFKVQKSSVSFL